MAVKLSRTGGFEEARRLLRQLPQNIEQRVVQGATLAGARELRKAVRAAAPMGKEPSEASAQYGRLKQNIRVIRLKRVPRGSKGARVWTFHAFWGYFLEFGTKHQPARPWLEPAIASAQSAAFDKMRQALVLGIEREANKLAGILGVKKSR
jgi:HK97 gp10 family phage protein